MSGSRQWKHLAAAVLMATVPALAQGAVLAPYGNDFTSSASDFTLSTAHGGWTLDTSGTGVLMHAGTQLTSGSNYTAAVEVSNLGGAATTDFIVTGQYVATAGNGTFSYVGLALLSDTATLSSTYYLVRQHISASSNNLRILRIFGGSAESVLEMTAERLDEHFGDAHELIVTGTYLDTNSDGSKDALELVVTLKNLTDGTQWTSDPYLDTAPLTGRFFGMKDSNANVNASLAVAWDAFQVALAPSGVIPEPTSLGLMAAGVSLLLWPTRARRTMERADRR